MIFDALMDQSIYMCSQLLLNCTDISIEKKIVILRVAFFNFGARIYGGCLGFSSLSFFISIIVFFADTRFFPRIPNSLYFSDVKVVVVFDAMMSGLPTHKESFAG